MFVFAFAFAFVTFVFVFCVGLILGLAGTIGVGEEPKVGLRVPVGDTTTGLFGVCEGEDEFWGCGGALCDCVEGS